MPSPAVIDRESTTRTSTLALERRRRVLGRLHGGRQLRREVDAHDRVGALVGHAAEGLLERARATGAAVSGSVGARGHAACRSRSTRELDAVDELLVAEADRQRHDLDAVAVDHVLRQVAGAVGDDADPAMRLLGEGWDR